jgi:primase-polymerase (primpol)-like protein
VRGTGISADQELIQQACNAANGETFEQLWNGDTTGYESHSEADMALCCYLAFWTGGNTSYMDDLFRQSGLMRDKWDTVHYADGSTYGEKTIERAVLLTNDFYSDE